jgi:hypothetical protein
LTVDSGPVGFLPCYPPGHANHEETKEVAMKLSELSYREWIAIEALRGTAASDVPADSLVAFAFGIADEFLAACGKRNQEIEILRQRAEKAETRVSVLLNMNEDRQLPARVALSQIWERLGVDNQTAAMQALESLFVDREHSHD